MGKIKRTKPTFYNTLGKDRPAVARANRFENELLLLMEANNYPKGSLKVEYVGTDIRIFINSDNVSEKLLDEIEILTKQFEDGEFFPPTEEEAKDIRELSQEGSES